MADYAMLNVPQPPVETTRKLPPTIDFNLTYPAEGGKEIHISIPVMPYAQGEDGPELTVRPAYVYDLCRGLAEIFGETTIVETQVHSGLEALMREGAHGTLIREAVRDETGQVVGYRDRAEKS